MSDELAPSSELTACVDTWWKAIDSFVKVVEDVSPQQWELPTDLAGWRVADVVAHVAHLEALLAGAEHDDVEVDEAPHIHGMMGRFTEQGVIARRGRNRDDLVNEIHESTTARHTELMADPPTAPDAPAPGLFGLIGWSTRTLLRNRPLDVWMHEQDIRRAIGSQGGLDTPAAAHTATYLLESLPLVVAKRAKAPAGTTVVVEVEGSEPVGVTVGQDGRGALTQVSETPTVRIGTDRESFIVLAGGRRRPEAERLRISGDADLAARIVDAMAVTP